MTTSRELFLERRRAELPTFLAVLRALPADRLDYRPHERSPSAGQLARTIVFGLRACVNVATSLRSEWKDEPAPPLDESIREFERLSAELDQRVSAMDDAAWERTARFYVGDRLVSEQPVSRFLWFILFDGIHHRGQLSAYLRPMGATVPPIYGPSADSRPG